MASLEAAAGESAVKIALVQCASLIGRPQENLRQMKESLRKATDQGAELILFPELALSGREVGALWNDPSFVEELLSAGEELIASSGEAMLLFGNVARCDRQLYNAIWAAQNGKVLPNSALQLDFFPACSPWKEAPLSKRAPLFDLTAFAGERGRPVAELLGSLRLNRGGKSIRLTPLVGLPGDELRFSPDLEEKEEGCIALFSSVPYMVNQREKSERAIASLAKELSAAVIHLNGVGVYNSGSNWYSLAGESSVCSADGGGLLKLVLLEESLQLFDSSELFSKDIRTDSSDCAESERSESGEIFQAITVQLRTFLAQSGVERVAVGLSGGIDSAVTAALCAAVLPPENLLLINMPSRYNSATTRRLARQQAELLHCWHSEVPIDASVDWTAQQLREATITRSSGDQLQLALTPFQLESVQARDRGARLLAAFASAFGAVYSCNSNKAELTVGYSTLYGDLGGFFAPLGDLWKHQVYALGRYLNSDFFGAEVIPQEVFVIPPSAELSPDHAVEEGKGDPLHYPYHDRLFRYWVERNGTAERALELYLSGDLEKELELPPGILKNLFLHPKDWLVDLERWWKNYQGMGAVKRIQAPPIASLSSHPFGASPSKSLVLPYVSGKFVRLKESLLRNSGEESSHTFE